MPLRNSGHGRPSKTLLTSLLFAGGFLPFALSVSGQSTESQESAPPPQSTPGNPPNAAARGTQANGVPPIDARTIDVYAMCGGRRRCRQTRMTGRYFDRASIPEGWRYRVLVGDDTSLHGFAPGSGSFHARPPARWLHHFPDIQRSAAHPRSGPGQPIPGMDGQLPFQGVMDHGGRIHLVSSTMDYAFYDGDRWQVWDHPPISSPSAPTIGTDLRGQPWILDSGGALHRPGHPSRTVGVPVSQAGVPFLRGKWHFDLAGTHILVASPGSIRASPSGRPSADATVPSTLHLVHVRGEEVSVIPIATERLSEEGCRFRSANTRRCLLFEEFVPMALEATTDGLMALYAHHQVHSRVRCRRVRCQPICHQRDCYLGRPEPICETPGVDTNHVCQVSAHRIERWSLRAWIAGIDEQPARDQQLLPPQRRGFLEVRFDAQGAFVVEEGRRGSTVSRLHPSSLVEQVSVPE